jgi:hypothetical protein
LHADPEDVLYVPAETALPFWVALGLALVFVAMLVQAQLVAIVGLAVAGVAVLRWAWRIGDRDVPTSEETDS